VFDHLCETQFVSLDLGNIDQFISLAEKHNVYPSAEHQYLILQRVVNTDLLVTTLAREKPGLLCQLFDDCLMNTDCLSEARAIITGVLEAIILNPKEELLSQDGKDQLMKFLDIRNKRLRRILEKLSDSNSVVERMAGIRTLLISTRLAQMQGEEAQNAMSDAPVEPSSRVHSEELVATLTFLAKKIRNETVLNRAEAIQNLEEHLGFDTLLCPCCFSVTLPLILGMLKDALESQDLDNTTTEPAEVSKSHPVLRTFYNASLKAF